MKSKGILILVLVIAAAALIGSFSSVYILEEGQQAIVLRFGQIVDIQTEAGLKFKLPFFFAEADVLYVFPKKLLSWDGKPQIIPTEKTEAQFIFVDTTARWYISDVKKFYESLGNMTEAYKKFDDVIDSAVRTVVNGNLLTEIIRDTKTPIEFDQTDFINMASLFLKIRSQKDNMSRYIIRYFPENILGFMKSFKGDEMTISDEFISQLAIAFNLILKDKNLFTEDRFKEFVLNEHARTLIEKKELTPLEQMTLNRILLETAFAQEIAVSPVKKGRTALSTEMLAIAKDKMYDRDKVTGDIVMDANGNPTNRFGIELKDVVIRQIRYSDDLRESVYQRMIKERNQIAERKRGEGTGAKEKLLGELDKEVKKLVSEGKMESEKIKGEADNYVTREYAKAYSRDPEFFRLWRTLESYKKTLPGFRKTLTTDADYFNYLYDSRGR